MSHLEVERTYTPTEGAPLPDLSAVGRVGPPVTAELEAVYLDTVDLRLTRAGVTLRRRTGGEDAGWHLKVPVGGDGTVGGREEVHRPLARALRTPPKPLRDAVLAWTLGAPLAPVAVVATHRTTRLLTDADGLVLAEVADDETRSGREEPDEHAWREVEVELVEGGSDVLDAVEELLLAAGWTHATVGRKIERTLAGSLPEPVEPASPGRKQPAAVLLELRLAEQMDELRRCDSEVRRGRPDAVHRARVAARRLRAALRTFAPLLTDGVADRLQRDLQRMTRALGPERDTEVAADRVADLLAACDPALVRGPVRTRLRSVVRARMRTHRAATLAELSSPEHLALLTALDRLVADPPWTPEARRRTKDVVPGLVEKDRARLATRLADADDDDALHRARSAAKRLRYAAEAVAPAYGKDARRLAKAAKRVTEPLGVLQDTRLSRALLLELAAAAEAAGEPSFTYGVLHAAEERAGAEARDLARRRA